MKKMLPFLLFIVFISCSGERQEIVESLTRIESAETSGKTVEELEADIRDLEEAIDLQYENYLRLATYSKALAIELMNDGLYGPALEALDQALVVTPENSLLHYRAGVCAANLGKNSFAPAEKNQYFERAEFSYRRSLFFDENLVDASYGLAVLLYYELDRPQEALEAVEQGLLYRSEDIRMLFLEAALVYENGRFEEAAGIYAKIIEIDGEGERADMARENRETILRGLSDGSL